MKTRLSLLIVGLGFALLLYMILVEDEPGAVPLVMIAAGLSWFLIIRRQQRRDGQQQGQQEGRRASRQSA